MITKTKTPIWEYLLLTALFCFSVSLFNKGGYIFVFVSILMLVLNVRHIKISLAVLALVIYSLLYFGFYANLHGFEINEVVIYLLGPWIAYLIGNVYVRKSKKQNAIIIFTTVLALGMFVHGVLNWITYMSSDLVESYQYYRLAVDVWRKEVVNVNTTGMMYTFATGIGLGALFAHSRKRYKVFATLILLTSSLLSAFFANRTLLLIIAIILLGELLLYVFSNKTSDRSKLVAIVIILTVSTVAMLLLTFNLWGVSDWFFSLKIVSRIGALGRVDVWLSLFESGEWLEYPFGNPNNTYRHNLWLDIYGEVGVFPFLMFVGITIYFIKRFFDFRTAAIRNGDDNTQKIFSCLCAATILNCAVEPIIIANPYYFLIIMMFMGAMEGYIQNAKSEALSCCM